MKFALTFWTGRTQWIEGDTVQDALATVYGPMTSTGRTETEDFERGVYWVDGEESRPVTHVYGPEDDLVATVDGTDIWGPWEADATPNRHVVKVIAAGVERRCVVTS